MAYIYKNTAPGRSYTNWTSKRGTSNQQLQAIPPITNTANGKRYYSSIDAELYFGDIFIDEVTNIGWSILQQTLPLYGYNSYTFDDVAVGSRIIQGQFAINFTERNFLINKVQNNSAFQKIARRMYNEDIPVAETDAGKIYSDFRQRLHLPMWDKGFDIVIGFGEDPKSNSSNTYGTYLVLDCVQITGSQIMLDYNGDPIMEMYSFIARDIKETFSDKASANPSASTSEANKTASSTNTIKLDGTLDLTKASGNLSLTCDNSAIVFTQATIQYTDSFTGSADLGVLYGGLPCSKNTIGQTLSVAQIAAYKKYCNSNNKDALPAIVNCTYTDSSATGDNKGKALQAKVNLTVKVKK